jgi:hypothetical protein
MWKKRINFFYGWMVDLDVLHCSIYSPMWDPIICIRKGTMIIQLKKLIMLGPLRHMSYLWINHLRLGWVTQNQISIYQDQMLGACSWLNFSECFSKIDHNSEKPHFMFLVSVMVVIMFLHWGQHWLNRI